MSLAPAALRARIEARIVAALGGGSPPWRVASLAYDAFPGADLSDREALSFAVGVTSTTFLDGRQPVGGVAPARSIVGVRWTSYLRTDAHVADYDRALEREVELVAAVRSTDGDGGPAARLVSSIRQAVGDSTVFLGELTLEVFHPYPIGA